MADGSKLRYNPEFLTQRGDAQQQRFQQMGKNANARGAYQVDYSQANDDRQAAYDDRGNAAGARSSQQDALGMQRDAATGAAPSRAELLGQQMAGQALNAQLAGAASARGGAMQQAAAMQGASANAAQYTQQAQGQMAAMRAGEMADARNAYASQAGQMRQQDYMGAAQAAQMSGQSAQQAQFQGQMEAGQRQLNQQARMGYEGMGQGAYQFGVQSRQQAEDAGDGQRNKEVDRGMAVASGGLGALGSLGVLSDERAKTSMQPLAQAPMGSLEPWMPPFAGPEALISDERSKISPWAMSAQNDDAPPPWSPPFTDPRVDLVSDERSKTSPYGYFDEGAPPRGLAGAPKGYAASRRGQAGDMFAPEPKADPDAGMAPGTADWARYGEPGKAQASADTGASFAKALKAAAGGFQRGMTSDERSKKKMSPMAADPDVAAEVARFEGSLPRGQAVNAEGTGRAQGGRSRVSDAEAERLSREADAMLSNYRASLAGPSAVDRGRVSDAEASRMSSEADRMRDESVGALRARSPLAEDPSAAEPARMLDQLGSGKTWRYREGVPGTDEGAEQHYGTTTQELRRSPMGASMVRPGPGGYDAIDTREAIGPVLASLGNLNQRLRRFEGR